MRGPTWPGSPARCSRAPEQAARSELFACFLALLPRTAVQVHGNVSQEEHEHCQQNSAGDKACAAAGSYIENKCSRSHAEGRYAAQGDLGDVVRAADEGFLEPLSEKTAVHADREEDEGGGQSCQRHVHQI